MRAEAHELIVQEGRVAGVQVRTPEGPLAVRADLVVAADGRHSTLRERAGLQTEVLGAPMDVLWMRLPREASDPGETFGHLEPGAMFVLINRRDYWQCAYVIPKGSFEELRSGGLPAFRESVARMAPFLRDRVGVLQAWDDVKLLTVAVDRLRQWWRPGLLCIGDAAHAMSPIGGVGINLAVQDAVAAANVLSAPLRAGTLIDRHLAAVQRRREFPTRVTQAMQIAVQNRVISRVLAKRGGRLRVPLFMRLLQRFPALRGIPARLIGVGVRPEHISPRS
jgi:2-polyprenyl-6-methoxyphenol hydroxylase-like FAD-dependent oxidoreductase